MTDTLLPVRRWIDVCAEHELAPDRGACVLVDGRQVALFRTSQDGAVHARLELRPVQRGLRAVARHRRLSR